jgi:hypothetical protein
MNNEFKRGVLAAAAVADDYNGGSTHKYRLGDCIAMKLNVVRGNRPRLNKKRVEDPGNAMIRGIALALADVHRNGGHSTAVCEAASAAGVTIVDMKTAGVDPFDWRELKKAGVPVK